MSATEKGLRQQFERSVRDAHDRVIELCVRLTQTNSENPPGDTSEIVSLIESHLNDRPGIEIRRVSPKDPVINLVARVRGKKPGRRLIFNGHLDTFPIGEPAGWSVPPISGKIDGNRIYGRGASDMKAGVAAEITAFLLLAEHREHFGGEVVLALVGDEETGGRWGTQYLLDNVPESVGDAMISGDAGCPRVVRFGEKGQLWLELVATGQSNHGAHVHLGVNAIDRLMEGLQRIHRLSELECSIPSDVRQAISFATSVSEKFSGEGESAILQRVTVNIGSIEGGVAPNIIPSAARACVDIRFPPGLTVTDVVEAAQSLLADLPDVNLRVMAASEPNVTEPNEDLVTLAVRNAQDWLKEPVVKNMRVGFSDARFYRYKGVPSIVYGATPHGMGGVDEYVLIDDLKAIFYVHAMTAFDFLTDSIKR